MLSSWACQLASLQTRSVCSRSQPSSHGSQGSSSQPGQSRAVGSLSSSATLACKMRLPTQVRSTSLRAASTSGSSGMCAASSPAADETRCVMGPVMTAGGRRGPARAGRSRSQWAANIAFISLPHIALLPNNRDSMAWITVRVAYLPFRPLIAPCSCPCTQISRARRYFCGFESGGRAWWMWFPSSSLHRAPPKFESR